MAAGRSRLLLLLPASWGPAPEKPRGQTSPLLRSAARFAQCCFLLERQNRLARKRIERQFRRFALVDVGARIRRLRQTFGPIGIRVTRIAEGCCVNFDSALFWRWIGVAILRLHTQLLPSKHID